MRAVAPYIALLLFSACGSGGDSSEPLMDERTPLAQETTERVFADGTFEILDTLQVDEPTFTPAELVMLENGHVLVYDRGSYQLLRIDPESGRIVTRYGEGIGSGPGEHLDVDGIGEFDSGQIWSFDQQSNAVNVFNTDGTVARRVALENRAEMVTAHSVDRFVGVNTSIEDPFRLYDADGRSSGGFGWFLDEPGLESLPFMGRVMPLFEDGFVFVVMNADLAKAYDGKGDLLWHRRLIDGREPLDVVPTDDGAYMLDYPENEALSRLPVNTGGEFVHILVVGREDDVFIVDTYGAADGAYLGSRRFPFRERMCGPKYIPDATTAWMICGSGTKLVRARIPALP